MSSNPNFVLLEVKSLISKRISKLWLSGVSSAHELCREQLRTWREIKCTYILPLPAVSLPAASSLALRCVCRCKLFFLRPQAHVAFYFIPPTALHGLITAFGEKAWQWQISTRVVLFYKEPNPFWCLPAFPAIHFLQAALFNVLSRIYLTDICRKTSLLWATLPLWGPVVKMFTFWKYI